MSKGIYGYWDNHIGDVVYIGKDARINNNRRMKDHQTPSRYNEQQINRVVQNNPDRYIYFKLCELDNCSDEDLNQLESDAITIFKTYKHDYRGRHVFNFTPGGDDISGKANPMYGKHHSEEWKKQNSERMKGNTHLLGHKHSDKTRAKMRESRAKRIGELAPSWKDYARVLKSRSNTVKNGYRYYIKYGGKRIKSSVHPHELYKWFAINYPCNYLYWEVNNGS